MIHQEARVSGMTRMSSVALVLTVYVILSYALQRVLERRYGPDAVEWQVIAAHAVMWAPLCYFFELASADSGTVVGYLWSPGMMIVAALYCLVMISRKLGVIQARRARAKVA